jgi:hypothetical protein
VRTAILDYLTTFVQDYAMILPSVRDLVASERDVDVLATALDHLGAFGSGFSWCQDVCLAFLHTHPSLAVRVAAANALVELQPAPPPPEALRLIAEVDAAPHLAAGLPEEPRDIHTLDTSFDHWPEEWALSTLGPEHLEIVVPIMLDGLKAPLLAEPCRTLVGRLITLLYRYERVRESADPRVVALRCALTRDAVLALLGLNWGSLEEFEAFRTAEVLIPMLYVCATVGETEVAWLERQRGEALMMLAAQRFWYRDNMYIIAGAGHLLAAMFADVQQRTTRALSDAERLMIATIVSALDAWAPSSERQNVAVLLREHYAMAGGRPRTAQSPST